MSASGVPSPVILLSAESTGNTSTTPLGSSATFTGTWVDVSDYATVTVTVFADVASAASGLKFDWSHDAANVDRTEQSDVAAGVGRAFNLTVRARYFRVRYVNGASAQATFRLGTVLKAAGSGLITRPLADPVLDSNFALLVKAALTGKNPSGDYINAAFSALGELIVTTPSAAAEGTKGFSHGYVATASIATFVVCAQAYVEQSSNARRSLVSTNANDTAAGTGARKVRITYLTSAGAGPYTEIVTLAGTTPVNTVATDICFIEKMEVTEAGSGGVNAGAVNLKAATGGGGATVITIVAGDNRTYCSHHYTPSGETTNITGMSIAHSGTTVGSGALFAIRSKPIGVANAAEIAVSDSIRLYGQSSTVSRFYDSPIQVVGPAYSRLMVTTESSTNLIMRGSFDYFDS